jgi:hypothetical protein
MKKLLFCKKRKMYYIIEWADQGGRVAQLVAGLPTNLKVSFSKVGDLKVNISNLKNPS